MTIGAIGEVLCIKMSIFDLHELQKVISEKIGDEIDQQLIEEMAELTQVLCKLRRADGQGQALIATKAEVQAALYEELADVIICLKEFIYHHDINEQMLSVIEKNKIARTMLRLKGELE